jgi:hypothetical protein
MGVGIKSEACQEDNRRHRPIALKIFFLYMSKISLKKKITGQFSFVAKSAIQVQLPCDMFFFSISAFSFFSFFCFFFFLFFLVSVFSAFHQKKKKAKKNWWCAGPKSHQKISAKKITP